MKYVGKEMCEKYAPEILDVEGLYALIWLRIIARGITEEELESFDNYVYELLNRSETREES